MKNNCIWAAVVAATLSTPALSAQQQGLMGEYYDGKNFERLVMTRTDAQINFVWDNVAPKAGMDPQAFSVKWKGQIKAPQTGKYMFRAKVDDGIRVKVGGTTVINAWGMNDSEKFMGQINLQEGQLYDLEVTYFNGLFEGEIQLFWQLPKDAPLFGGALGYNDQLISSQYFFQPKEAATPPPAPKKEIPPPAPKPKKETPKTTKPKPQQPKPASKVTAPAPQPAPAAKPVVLTKDSIERFTPKNILFERSRTAMIGGSKAELDLLAGFLVRHPKVSLTIEGHTDNLGDAAKNLELSQKRAEAVAAYLTSKGVAANRMKTIGYGDTRPLVKSDKGSPQNRRVVFLMQE